MKEVEKRRFRRIVIKPPHFACHNPLPPILLRSQIWSHILSHEESAAVNIFLTASRFSLTSTCLLTPHKSPIQITRKWNPAPTIKKRLADPFPTSFFLRGPPVNGLYVDADAWWMPNRLPWSRHQLYPSKSLSSPHLPYETIPSPQTLFPKYTNQKHHYSISHKFTPITQNTRYYQVHFTMNSKHQPNLAPP
jgi:hypothetical protein